eukprot:1183405-Prorocentrum_minimum.AAC.2
MWTPDRAAQSRCVDCAAVHTPNIYPNRMKLRSRDLNTYESPSCAITRASDTVYDIGVLPIAQNIGPHETAQMSRPART